MSTQTIVVSREGPPLGFLDTHVESFLGQLRATGYAERTLRKKRSILRAFTRWSKTEQLVCEQIGESHVAAFVKQLPKHQRLPRQSVLHAFLAHLRMRTGMSAPAPQLDCSLAARLYRRYIDYLRDDRGLAENSILVYTPHIHDLLNRVATSAEGSCSPLPDRLEAGTIRDFILDRIRGRSSSHARLLVAALRSFLRFLYSKGETATDLSVCVPAVCVWQQAAVPLFLSVEEVNRVLAAPDRSTARGRRDHAILLLLARLGLRAGEVVRLELSHINWRSGNITIHGKGPSAERLPLLCDIGEALALYLSKDRSSSESARVFLRMIAPQVGLSGPAAVGHIVRKALADAHVQRSGRGAAHIFRHSLATRMIRHGASLGEISQVLRHRSENTTALYAKVDFEALRGVARLWPSAGGAR